MNSLLTNLINPDGWARRMFGRKRAVILLYHSPDAYNFELHLKYLSRYYQFITLDKLVTAIEENSWECIPKNAMVVTFDDGHASNYNLLSLFKKFKLQPTIYLCTKIVGTNNSYWWSGLEKTYVERLKRLANKDRLSKLTLQPVSFSGKKREGLSGSEIKEMREYVDFESHTRTHPIVTMLSESELSDELKEPIEDLRDIGIRTSHFAYPNGDYSKREMKFLQEAGYRSARTTDAGWVKHDSNLLKLRIMGITDNASIHKLRWQLSGLFGWLLYLRNGYQLNGRKKIIKPSK